jgi:diaminopimelate decarboxylase
MLELFPDTAAVDGGELAVGGARLSALAEEHGTPLVVYCEETLRTRAQAYRRAAPDALVLYSVKAFPNVALLRLFAGEGLGADASTAGELTYARRAGIPGERIVLHGNNKSDDELRSGADVALVVVDALEEIERARAAGVRTALVRVTPGIDVDTHPAIGTAHYGSKFGLPPEQALEAIARLRDAGIEAAGLHLHLGSQLLELSAARLAVDWLGGFAAECRERLRWSPSVIDVGGGLGVRYSVADPELSIADFVRTVLDRLDHAWRLHGLPPHRLMLEPGRSLVGQAGVTIYRVGVVKRASETTTYIAIDGGMSDNPRPQLYGARLTAVLASCADEAPSATYAVCGKHCESGDVLIDRIELPEPRRGEVLAVPATGAYTLAMASNYNGVPRPAAVLVRDGRAQVIRRRETVDDLLALEP